jgi:mono/diheme cytochrome c family protein
MMTADTRASTEDRDMAEGRARIAGGIAALAVAAVLPRTAAVAADAEAGARLVQRWCVSCHATERSRAAADVAPSLATIAQTRGGSPGWLRAWLAAPHPPMPNLTLSNREIDDVIAYLQTLRK